MNAATTSDTKLSDALVYREVVNYLSGPGCPKIRGVVIEVVDGVITLRGPVPSYYTRQLLVHGCKRVPRVARVVDELCVVSGTGSHRTQLAD
jgi:hypothetical protein